MALQKEAEMCEEFGFYEVSRGYRKIPGNICKHGHKYEPQRYSCSLTSRIVTQIFSVYGAVAFALIFVLMFVSVLRNDHLLKL